MNMMTPRQDRYWVVGGEYLDTRFAELKAETAQIFGPFMSYDLARARWRTAAEATRSDACTRFAIVSESFA